MEQRALITDLVIARIRENPNILDMRYFAARTPHGTTYCFAGLITQAAGVAVEFDPASGLAINLARGERTPAESWISYELRQIQGATVQHIIIPAMAREIWAGEHGVAAAEILPVYAEDWGVSYECITAGMLLDYLECIKRRVHVDEKPPISKIVRRRALRAA